MRPMFSSSVVAKIERAVQEVGGTTDTKEDLAFVTLQSKQCINSMKSHLLRSTNQDEARLDVIDELDETSALLVLDRAMKYLPKKFRESQTDWFGKRDLPWHITVATRKGNDGKIEMMTFVHLFETCNQDSSAVLAILNDVFRRLKDVMPHLQSIYLRQDNAGYYHCALTLVTASKVAELNNLFLRRMDFSDPQGGKGSCDRKAATIKSHMAIHLNSGHDIESGISNAGGNRIIWRCSWSKSSVLQASFVFHQKASEMGWCELCQQRSVWRGRCESMEILQNWKRQIHSLEQVSCS